MNYIFKWIVLRENRHFYVFCKLIVDLIKPNNIHPQPIVSRLILDLLQQFGSRQARYHFPIQIKYLVGFLTISNNTKVITNGLLLQVLLGEVL